MPKIVIEKGVGRGDTFPITKGGVIRVGRDPNSVDILLKDDMVSRKHMKIVSRDSGFYVCDSGSLNGIYVNGARIAETRIHPGDRIKVGDCLLSLLENDERRTSGGLVNCKVAEHLIVERIGRGGMGTVYRAIQLSLDRSVAIKFLAPELTRDPKFVELFETEALATGHLSHANIVQVFDTGSWEGLCYYTMEFMPFGSIGNQIVGGRSLPVENVLPMMVDVAHGLIYAVSLGIN